MSERDDLIQILDRHRGFLLHTAQGLTEEQARTTSTVSALTIAGILKHVADTEEQWMGFAARGVEAFSWAGATDSVYEADIDWQAVEASVDDAAEGDDADEGETDGEDWSASEWEDTRFVVTDEQTLEVLRARIAAVAAGTAEFLGAADLDHTQPLPEAPWFEPGAAWSVRRVAMHVLAEISQHAGHADIIREAIDGQHTMG